VVDGRGIERPRSGRFIRSRLRSRIAANVLDDADVAAFENDFQRIVIALEAGTRCELCWGVVRSWRRRACG